MKPKKIVITGGPSTGKTSIINKIDKKGYSCLHEISRTITLEARNQGIDQLFVSDPLLFSQKLLEGRIQQFHQADKINTTTVFLDRGIPDIVAYMKCVAQSYASNFSEACENHRYDQVFLLPPWKEIHTTDNERYEGFDEAVKIHRFLKDTYTNFGYKLTTVPIGTVDERTKFILNHINKTEC